ncbi:MAG: hypothetical protein V1892_02550 [bacterium]
MISDKTLNNAELELTQKLQMHFPRGVISPDVLKQWNTCQKEAITARLVEAFSKGPEIVSSATEHLLEFLGTIIIPDNPEKFVVKKKFIVDTGKKAPIKISYLGSNLQEWFLNKVEGPSEKTVLRKDRLRKASIDMPIIAELGGHNKVATTWFAIWHLMIPNQLDKNLWHVFYMEDEIRFPEDKTIAFTNAKSEKGVLRAVYVFWLDGGWDLTAHSVLSPYWWSEGRRFFSRNSSET